VGSAEGDGVEAGVGAGVGAGDGVPAGVGVGVGIGVSAGAVASPPPPQAVRNAAVRIKVKTVWFDLLNFMEFFQMFRGSIANKSYVRFVVSVIFEDMTIFEKNNHGLRGLSLMRC
jgi:hypothetical protein